MNCLEEFKEHVEEVNKQVLCAHLIINGVTWVISADGEHIRSWRTDHQIFIKKGFQESDLDVLDFNYREDDGYRGDGDPNLCGSIWFTDGTWSKRDCSEYFEYWYHITKPELPEELNI